MSDVSAYNMSDVSAYNMCHIIYDIPACIPCVGYLEHTHDEIEGEESPPPLFRCLQFRYIELGNVACGEPTPWIRLSAGAQALSRRAPIVVQGEDELDSIMKGIHDRLEAIGITHVLD